MRSLPDPTSSPCLQGKTLMERLKEYNKHFNGDVKSMNAPRGKGFWWLSIQIVGGGLFVTQHLCSESSLIHGVVADQ